jgi:DNA-binding XRE family transcriptional regulator
MKNTEYSQLLAQMRNHPNINLNDDELAKEIGFTRMTLYKRLLDHKWKSFEIEKLLELAKKYELI